MLSDFFMPLNAKTLTEFVLLFLFFDMLGTFTKRFILRIDRYEVGRILNWLIGLGIFIFIWFCLSLLLPYKINNLLISIVVLVVLTIYPYIKNKDFFSLLKEIWKLKVPILIILPFLPAVFVKASLPPYYADEMAYHFISPYAVMHLGPIKYVGGLYADLPRMMNTFYEIVFSLTKTYSIARLFHFSILVTSMAYTYKIIKRNFGFAPAFLFVFVFFSLPQDTILVATLGYIDVAAFSFLLIGVVSVLTFFKSPNSTSLLLTIVFWAMNLGTKYTGVGSFVAFVVAVVVLIIYDRKRYFKFFNRSLIMKSITLFIIFGGYWYIKNFIMYGNPIFPFIFPCQWGTYVEKCPLPGGGFFGGWTTEIKLSNAYLIISQLFVRSRVLHILTIIVPLLAMFSDKKLFKIIALACFLPVALELLLLKNFSGFYVRYQQHMQLYLLLGIVISLGVEYKNIAVKAFSRVLMLILFLSSSILYLYSVKQTNSLGFLNWNEINYSIGKMNIYEWVDVYFPRMSSTIIWCEKSQNGKIKLLARYDPDLIWFDYDGLKRVFLLNCEYVNPPLVTDDIKMMITQAKKDKLQFYIASKSRCIPDEEVKKIHATERDDMLELRKINNKIICNSKEIEPNLYYFDYTKL